MKARVALVVEDDARLLHAVAFTLKREGFTVTTATSGAEARTRYAQLCENGGVDLIITDEQLPDMRGEYLIDQVRAGRVSVPVVVITARRSAGLMMALERRGVSDVLNKPFDAAELCDCVARCLRRRQPTEGAEA